MQCLIVHVHTHISHDIKYLIYHVSCIEMYTMHIDSMTLSSMTGGIRYAYVVDLLNGHGHARIVQRRTEFEGMRSRGFSLSNFACHDGWRTLSLTFIQGQRV